MINFIVCDDEKLILEKVKEIITTYMMGRNEDYKIYLFSEINSELEKLILDDSKKKIYILDIQLKLESGIDLGRKIREKDYTSVIIYITVHTDFGALLLKTNLMYLGFVNKHDNFQKNIIENIDKAIKILGFEQSITFKYEGVLFQIPIKDIMYIVNSKSINKKHIVTEYGEFPINMSLTSLAKILTNIVRSHRSCYVNPRYIKKIDKNSIQFKNDKIINFISNKYIKGIL